MFKKLTIIIILLAILSVSCYNKYKLYDEPKITNDKKLMHTWCNIKDTEFKLVFNKDNYLLAIVDNKPSHGFWQTQTYNGHDYIILILFAEFKGVYEIRRDELILVLNSNYGNNNNGMGYQYKFIKCK